MDKSPDAFRTISEAAADLDVPQHVLRFWETRFTQIKPMKRGGGRRYYRPEDMELLRAIRHLLYGEGYTIKGVQRLLKEQGVRQVVGLASGVVALPAPARIAPGMAPDLASDDDMIEPADDALVGGLSADDQQRLRMSLAEISECLRILSAVNG